MTDTKTPRPSGARAVERTLTLSAPVSAVWRALTDAEELMRWFPLEASVTPGEGGAITLGWSDLYNDTARITVWQPERHLRFGFPAEGPAPLMTDYYLEGKAGATTLRVVTSGFGSGADWDEQFRGVSHGWDFELVGLKHYLERHWGRDRVVGWARGRSGWGYAETWRRLVSPGGAFGSTGLPAEYHRGDQVPVALGGEEAHTGTVMLWQPPRQIAAVIGSMNDGLFRAELTGPEGEITVVVWLSTYDVPAARVAEIERGWRALMLDRFPGA